MCVPRGGDVSREGAGALAQKNQLASLFERSEPDTHTHTHTRPPPFESKAQDLESVSNSEFKPANSCGCTVTQQVSDDSVWTDKYTPCEKANPYYARYLADFSCKAGKKEFAC